MWFDFVVMLNVVVVNKNNLVECKRMSYFVIYYDYNEKLKISVICE